MADRKMWWSALAGILFLFSSPLWGAEISVEGGPAETGFNSGTFVNIHATVHGIAGKPKRYVVFAEIQYFGTTSSTSVEMDRLPETKPGIEEFQVGWPIPAQAPTGFYTLSLHVDDRIDHTPEVTRKVRGFVVYKKLARISRVTLDKAQYSVGDPIQCEVGLENLSDADLKDLRVEFSNAIYPWISLKPQGGRDIPELLTRTLREHIDLPAGTAVTIPMAAAGTATLLAGKQRDADGSPIAPGTQNSGFPEVDTYAVALWNADHTVLYDMQFTAPAMVRPLDRDVPKPYSRNFTHPYNASIDFTKYREFYAPGQVSAALRVDSAHTLYRPGDTVKMVVTVKNPGEEAWSGAALQVGIRNLTGKEVYSGTMGATFDLATGAARKVTGDAWTIPSNQLPGTYVVTLELAGRREKLLLAETTTEIAINEIPTSLLVICGGEDDEPTYAGLIRAAEEAGAPVLVVMLTAGDSGECARYIGTPCGPNEARELAEVRIDESAQALEHLGVPRDKFIVLGLPDDVSETIWFDHKESSNPFLSVTLACDHAPYANAYKPNLPYARSDVVEAIRQIIADFRPAEIALANPDDRNGGRRISSWFAIQACLELVKAKGLDPQTIVLADQLVGPGVPHAAPYKYENYVVHLSAEAAALKQEMAWLYQSRNGNQLEAGRKTLAELPREEKHLRILDWQEHEGWNETTKN